VAKRPFVRRDGYLFDTYLLSNGKECTHQMPALLLDEPLTDELRGAARESAASEWDPAHGAGLLGWDKERSPESLKALLAGLQAGNIGAPMPLLQYVDSPEVRPALIEAVRRTKPEHLANFAQVVGLAGGEGAVEVLEQRLAEILGLPQTFEDHPFFNDLAGSAVTLAVASLALDPDSSIGADAFERLWNHPCRFNQRSTVSDAASAFRRHLQTEAMRRIKALLEPLVEGPDDELFLAGLRAFGKLSPERTKRRCLESLSHESEDTFPAALFYLVSLPLGAGVLPDLLAWLEGHRPLRNAITVAGSLGKLVPPGRLRELCTRGLADESPTLRLDAWRLLRLLEPNEAHAMAHAAASDEPDPSLRRRLERGSEAQSPG
jgi:hypothetical protein